MTVGQDRDVVRPATERSNGALNVGSCKTPKVINPAHQFANDGSDTEFWRSIVLFGLNVASYKFALAKSLLELASQGEEKVPLSELAVPFSRNICEHLVEVDRQGTFRSSKFLDACRYYNAGRINETELITATEILGFKNVIDAFHVVGGGEVPTRFFLDERRLSLGGIRLTDEVLQLAQSPEVGSLTAEAEARWRLVEEAWSKEAAGEQVVVLYDAPREILVPALTGKRKTLTGVRPALNGYQKGHCFYCYGSITVVNSDVDHFLPHSLMARGMPVDLDGVWNLVLACQDCNRGSNGKFASIPHARYLKRLSRRNEFLIGSHHPLRETLILATGANESQRNVFLKECFTTASTIDGRKAKWKTNEVTALKF